MPVANSARNTWITATALSTALNMSYMAEQMALFGIVVGIALLLTGLGLAILTLGGALRGFAPAAQSSESRTSKPIVSPVAPSV